VLQFNWYVLVLILSALISAVLAIIAFRKIHAVGSPEMAGLMLSLTLWASAAAGGAACTSLIAKITWTVISYLGSQIVPVWFLLFIYTFTRQTRQFTLGEKVALFFIPLITVTSPPPILTTGCSCRRFISSEAQPWAWLPNSTMARGFGCNSLIFIRYRG
jgi:hypothetical protein